MAISVDHGKARAILLKAWLQIPSTARPPARMQKLIENVLGASDVTFKYLLITGYLAKCANPASHTRAIQVGSALPGAYDARSLCHKVIIGFEKERGNLFGLSNEPYVNKPARHPEHDGANAQLRNRIGAQILHDALEAAQAAKPAQIYQGLVHILRLGAANAANEKQIIAATKVSLSIVVNFIKTFLAETNGGSRLVAVWGAFQKLLSENGEIKVCSPNASDYFGGTSGDVEVYYADVLVSASECKQRPLNLDDVNHGLRKSREKGVPEYLFVYSAGLADGQEPDIRAALNAHAQEVDSELLDIWKVGAPMAAMLNPLRRAKFGETVVELLRAMRKFDSANKAADLWNKLTT
jgi:hypothetical protein